MSQTREEDNCLRILNSGILSKWKGFGVVDGVGHKTVLFDLGAALDPWRDRIGVQFQE